ncbi:phosphoribosylglycinamide formyltransferase [Acidipila sp. EB88]|uniref:phosphoribosylglycinamide formyltransferase n=1 Tax=Acidipila sp. EB88 TaxID=2305226 RepID=UPI000F5EF0D0|nr:phosphoribosylglycinamide formyltransferase [Acidipila sp. EB88]RRA48322.1 phosphoribosylglycinamide formyltransferase [Acidipila sp. EB88]
MIPRHRLGVLISGRGSNLLALAEAIDTGVIPDAVISLVLSNKEDAPGLAHARALEIPALAITARGRSRAEQDREFIQRLQESGVTLVCLAGYMRLLSPEFIHAFPQAILNIHPSLLPAFPGLDAQAQALRYGVRTSGCTVHFVDEQLDHGVIVAQGAVPVLPGDDEASLSARILAQEHRLYPQAIAEVLAGGWRIEGRRLVSR